MSMPRSDRKDEDSEEGSRVSGYDRPRSPRGRNSEKGTEETEVEFHQMVVMLLVEATRVILTPLLVVTTPTPHLLIRTKSW